jgi:hypothetical protein
VVLHSRLPSRPLLSLSLSFCLHQGPSRAAASLFSRCIVVVAPVANFFSQTIGCKF